MVAADPASFCCSCFRACDNPFGWIKDDKNRAYTGLCSFQDPFLRGLHSGFSEKKTRPLDLGIHKPYKTENIQKKNRKIRPEEIIG
jgi:hypothetical protein